MDRRATPLQVLMVEDSPADAELIARALRERAAHVRSVGHAPVRDGLAEFAHRAHDQLGIGRGILDHQHLQGRGAPVHQSGTSLASIQYMPIWATVEAKASKSTGFTT